MSVDDLKRVEELFAETCALPPPERASFLEQACGSDRALRQEVESLLNSDAEADTFLQEPALGSGFSASESKLVHEPEDYTPIGRLLGVYRIKGLIDAGGMGAAYVASRDDDEYEKQVAIKLIKRGRAMLMELLGAFDPFAGDLDVMEAKAGALIRDLADQPEEKAEFLESIADIWEKSRLYHRSIAWRREALDLREKVLTLADDDPRMLRSRYGLGHSLLLALRYEEAKTQLEAALEGLRRDHGTAQNLLSPCLRSLARSVLGAGDFDSPLPLFQEALELEKRENSRQESLIATLVDFAQCREACGDRHEAEQLLRQAERLVRPDTFTNRRLKAEVYDALGMLLWNSPGFRDAETYVRRALAELHTRFRKADVQYSEIRMHLAALLLARGDSYSAVALSLQALARIKSAYGQETMQFAEACCDQAMIDTTRSRSEGEIFGEHAFSFYKKWLGDAHPKLAEPMTILGTLWTMTGGKEKGKLEKAEWYLRRALELRRQTTPRHWQTALSKSLLGNHLCKQGRYEEAEPLILESHKALAAILGANHPRAVKALGRAVKLYEAWGREKDEGRYRKQMDAAGGRWPFRTLLGDDDGRAENLTVLKYDDDFLEKTILIPQDPAAAISARLWILGKPFHRRWENFSGERDFHIMVNGNPDQVQSFDISLAFSDQADSIGHDNPEIPDRLHWVPIEIPVPWLIRGANTFLIFEDLDYAQQQRLPREWDYNNLQIGIDTTNDSVNRSWWYVGFEKDGRPMAKVLDPGRAPGHRPTANGQDLATEVAGSARSPGRRRGHKPSQTRGHQHLQG